jgi:hypothetical protein
MPVSPTDFYLWARSTGNKYPETVEEKAAAAPHAYDFVRNLGKTGGNAPGARVGGRIVYDQPISLQYADNNSLLQAPVTPDNNVPKVAGTVDNTMTAEHYDNQLQESVEDNRSQHNLIRNVGRAALGAGLVAGGAIYASSPQGQQAIRTAADTVKQHATNIGSRVSGFLGGLGVPRVADSDVIRNTGDVTPPTTAQNYHQAEVPSATQSIQVAKGAAVGSPAEATLPPTTESYTTKPVTESDIITSSQSFSPRGAGYGSHALAEFEEARPVTPEVQEARSLAARQQLSRAAETIRSREPYQLELPGVKPTLMTLRSKEVDIDPEAAGIVTAPEVQQTISPSTHQYSLLSETPDPWTGKYTSKVPAEMQQVSEQTADLTPTVGKRVDEFLTVLDLAKGERVNIPKRALGVDVETPRGLVASMVEEPVEMPSPAAATEMTAAGPVAGPRQRIGRAGIPAEHREAYKYMTAAAERGVEVPFERALQIMTDPTTEMSHAEQQAFEFNEPVALAGQSFAPGEQTTGQMRTLRTGEQRGQRAEALLERYARENVSGLTPTGRQSAGAQRLRGVEEQDEPRAVLTTPTGRAMRNISALDPEALAEGREEYATFTGQTTGSNPVAAAAAYKSATRPEKVAQMNALLGPESSSIMLHLKTEAGLKPMATKELHRSVGPIAENVFDRAATHYATQLGMELPNKEQSPIEYKQAANTVLYGNKEVSAKAIPQMAKAFDQGLRQAGLKLSVSADPNMAPGALHTLMNVARRTTGGELSLQHFSTLAGRARAQGAVRTQQSVVPTGIPGPSSEQVADVMRRAGL